MRERLIELLASSFLSEGFNLSKVADRLLANGVVVIDNDIVTPKNRPLILTFAGMPFNELLELVQAKDEGRIIVPPCKVGDTCWYIRHYLKKHHIIVEGVVDDAVYTVRGGWAITVKAIKNHFRGWLGETVFLTRGEAEKALEGRAKKGGGEL
jgi:hypothetical protein